MKLLGKIVLCIALIAASIEASAATVYVGKSARLNSYNLGLRMGFLDVEWIDEGHQPYNIPNINRILNVDAVISYRGFFLKGGVTTSHWGFNGSGNGYQNTTGFTGHNEAIGWSHKFGALVIGAEAVNSIYQQVSAPQFETFQYLDGFLGCEFK